MSANSHSEMPFEGYGHGPEMEHVVTPLPPAASGPSSTSGQHQQASSGTSTPHSRSRTQRWQGHTSIVPGYFDSALSTPVGTPGPNARRAFLSSSTHGNNSPVLSPTSNPFGSASNSDNGIYSSSVSTASHERGQRPVRQRKMFKSQLLREDEEPYKPWIGQKARTRADRKAYWTFVIAVFIGIAGAAALIATGYLSVPQNKYCLVMQDNFDGPTINDKIWFHEQQTGGFGNGEFEWTTSSTNNSYIKDGQLYIVPTLTSDALGEGAITNGYTLNLTAENTCTSSNTSDVYCAVASNSSTGVVLPPVQSARLMTNFSTTIKYGRVEIRAKMPTGNWLWPALWMMPQSNVYGEWPRSGEIDIFESRGNIIKSKNDDTYNTMHSTLHWGLDSKTDRYSKTTKVYELYRDWYNEQFHTFGLEWTPEGIYTWVDTPVRKVLSLKFGSGFWDSGNFPTVSANGTAYSDPWPQNAPAAPFDQKFYLILSLAVGGTNGYFDSPDMPWSNNADNARAEFWNAKDKWYPTWPQAPEQRGMIIDYVKVYQLQGVEGAACPAA